MKMLLSHQFPTLLIQALRFKKSSRYKKNLRFKYLTSLFLLFTFLPISADSLYVGDKPIPPAVQVVEAQTNLLLSELSDRKDEFTANPASLVDFAKTIALKHWDLTKASRLMLGPHWRKASTDQRTAFEQEFLRTLLRYVVKAYGYYDESLIDVVEYRWKPARRGGWVLSKVEVPGGLKVNVDYRMESRKDSDHWRLIDVRVEGISLVGVKKSEYHEMVMDEGFDALVAFMAEKNNKVLAPIFDEKVAATE